MQHLIDDLDNLRHWFVCCSTRFTAEGRLLQFVKAARPTWSRDCCQRLTAKLVAEGFSLPPQQDLSVIERLESEISRHECTMGFPMIPVAADPAALGWSPTSSSLSHRQG
jgi:hypothetical protein